MDTLRITSCQAANADPWVAAVVAYLAERYGLTFDFGSLEEIKQKYGVGLA